MKSNNQTEFQRKAELQEIRKRKLNRDNQRRFRERQRKRENEITEAISFFKYDCRRLKSEGEMLKHKNAEWQEHVERVRLDSVRRICATLVDGFLLNNAWDDFDNPFELLSDNMERNVRLLNIPVMARNVCKSNFQAFIMQMALYARLHEKVEVNVVHIQMNGDVARVQYEMNLTLARSTIFYLYPNLLRHAELQERVIGRVLKVSVHVTYYYGVSKVVRVDTEANYLQAWLELLNGAVQDAYFVMENALVNPINMWIQPTQNIIQGILHS